MEARASWQSSHEPHWSTEGVQPWGSTVEVEQQNDDTGEGGWNPLARSVMRRASSWDIVFKE